MDNILHWLLILNPIKPGFYDLLDYVGTKTNIKTRISLSLISTIITFTYTILFSYIIYNQNKQFTYKRFPFIVSLIIGIILLVIFFVIKYYSIENTKKYCSKILSEKYTDSLSLINTEKTLTLIYFSFIYVYIYFLITSYKKYKLGYDLIDFKKGYTFYLIYIITIIMLFFKIYQLQLLIKQKKLINL